MTLNARNQPAGAVFHRCALQVNPHDYRENFRGGAAAGDARAHAEAVAGKAAEIGVSVLAVTAHNNVDGVAAFRRAAADYAITIFPGFELTSSEGIHVLCIYPPSTGETRLERYLGAFGIREPGPSAQLARQDFAEILQRVREQGGIPVAAHVTGASGLLRRLQGQPRIQAWRHEHLLAVQIPGPVEDLKEADRRIVVGKDAAYRRSHPVAVINARDVDKPEDLENASATCWIKMSEVTIDGLRQAFLDPESRVRLNSDPPSEEHAEVLALAWEGGFLDGGAIRFNPNLNVLIGGRGAGKSTVIESLRYVLDLKPTGDEADKTHKGIVRQVLRSGTKISLRARFPGPAAREYLIERVVPNPPVVRDADGRMTDLRPGDVFPGIEIYGQHEISELARSADKLTSLLQRFVERAESPGQRKAAMRRDLEHNGRALLDVRAELQQLDDRMASLPGLEETLKRFQAAGLEDRLQERSLLVREEQVLARVPERLQSFQDCLATLRRELPIDRAFLSPEALVGLPGGEILAAANPVFERLSDRLEQAAALIAAALDEVDAGVGAVRRRWDARKQAIEAAYQQILRELQESAVDAEEFIRLRREIEALRPLRERRPQLERLEKTHAGRRSELLAEWEALKAQEFRLLDRAAKRVSAELRGRVHVEVSAAGNREPLLDVLKEELGGRLSEALDKIRQAPEFSLPKFVGCCADGAQAVQKTYAVPPAQAERLANAPPDVLMRLEALDLPPTTTLRLNTAADEGPPSWQALDALSTGQKATAVLLLLLLDANAPLIVDQPEDDLDNRFITEGVVPRMRAEKRRRQFVFSTHNANIPVLGDAELILGLTPAGEAGAGRAAIRPEHAGSIDAPPVRELVEEILEGGKNAFETRRLKYGF